MAAASSEEEGVPPTEDRPRERPVRASGVGGHGPIRNGAEQMVPSRGGQPEPELAPAQEAAASEQSPGVRKHHPFEKIHAKGWGCLAGDERAAILLLGLWTEKSWDAEPIEVGNEGPEQSGPGQLTRKKQQQAAERLGFTDAEFDATERLGFTDAEFAGGIAALRDSWDKRRASGGGMHRRALSWGSASQERHRRQLQKAVEKRWEDDESSSNCMCCGEEFNLRRRKHHCRRCGLIVCNNCSKKMAGLRENCKPKAKGKCPPPKLDAMLLVCTRCEPAITANADLQKGLAPEDGKLVEIGRVTQVVSSGLLAAPSPHTKILGVAGLGLGTAIAEYAKKRQQTQMTEVERLQLWSNVHRTLERAEVKLQQDLDDLLLKRASEDTVGLETEMNGLEQTLDYIIHQHSAIAAEDEAHRSAVPKSPQQVTLLLQLRDRKSLIDDVFRRDCAEPGRPCRQFPPKQCCPNLPCRIFRARTRCQRYFASHARRIVANIEAQLHMLDRPALATEQWNAPRPPPTAGFFRQSRLSVLPAVTSRIDHRPIRILCIDGGGSKGLIPAIILEKIEEICAPHKVHELFDLVCGTSTGGILALGTCVAKLPVRVMTDGYEHCAKEVWQKGAAVRRPTERNCKYSATGLEEMLKRNSTDWSSYPATCPPMLNSDPAAMPKVFVVAAEQKQGAGQSAPFKKCLLRSYKGRTGGIPEELKLWQAGRATSAAPTYFSPLNTDEKVLVDGGLIANNPVQLALAEANVLWPNTPVGLVVSLGCGLRTKSNEDAGSQVIGQIAEIFEQKEAVQLAFLLKEQMTNTQTAHEAVLEEIIGDVSPDHEQDKKFYQYGGTAEAFKRVTGYEFEPMERYEDTNYMRLNPPMTRSIAMDTVDADDLAELRKVAEDFLEEGATKQVLKDLVDLLHKEEEGAKHEPEPEPKPELQ
eukprot:COSAG05_NODE_2008_length_3713_cov_106.491699_1_plen_926_part_00